MRADHRNQYRRWIFFSAIIGVSRGNVCPSTNYVDRCLRVLGIIQRFSDEQRGQPLAGGRANWVNPQPSGIDWNSSIDVHFAAFPARLSVWFRYAFVLQESFFCTPGCQIELFCPARSAG